jgi:hypothetical protein
MALSKMQQLLPKAWWFALFNVGIVIYLIASGDFRWDWVDVLSAGMALLLIDGVILFSTRRYPEWKWTFKQQKDRD